MRDRSKTDTDAPSADQPSVSDDRVNPEETAAPATGATIEGDTPEGATSTGAGDNTESSVAERAFAEQRDRYLRLAAEFDNYRKRSARERQEAEARGQSVVVRGLLDALDDLGRFAHVDPATTDTKTLVDGVEMIEKKLLKTLAGHGLEVVNPLDHPFDPNVHEALTTMPAASQEEDHLVAQVFQVGYLFHGQLLRPARVVVKQWNG